MITQLCIGDCFLRDSLSNRIERLQGMITQLCIGDCFLRDSLFAEYMAVYVVLGVDFTKPLDNLLFTDLKCPYTLTYINLVHVTLKYYVYGAN